MVAEPRRLQQLWAVNSPLRHKADTGKVLSAVLCVLNRATKKEKLKKIALKATCDDRMKRTVRGGHVDNIVDKLVRRAQAAATTMSSPRACGSPSSGMAATRRRLGDTPTVVTGAVPTVEAPLDTPGRRRSRRGTRRNRLLRGPAASVKAKQMARRLSSGRRKQGWSSHLRRVF